MLGRTLSRPAAERGDRHVHTIGQEEISTVDRIPWLQAGEAIDWSEVRDEIQCSRCGYNLRGLDRPRCPECGLQFEWEDVFLPERRPHPYLYEHHQGDDRLRRFRKTLLGALRPIKFWRTMRITHLHRRGPLVTFAACAFAIVTAEAFVIALAGQTVRQLNDSGLPLGSATTSDLMATWPEAAMDLVIEPVIRALQ